MKLGGLVTGVLGLAALEVVTSSAGAANRTAAIPMFAAAFVERIVSPNLGLIPNFKDASGAAPLAAGDAQFLAANPAAAQHTRPGGTVTTGAGARVRSAPTTTRGPVGPGI